MNETDINKILIEIQDRLVPILDTYEQAIYRFVFRHTILEDKREVRFSARSAEIGYGQGVNNQKPSGKQRSKKLTSLAGKGAIKIVEKSNLGSLVRIVLPNEIEGLSNETEEIEVDIEELDFYKDKRLLNSILERENYKCFYTGRNISKTNCHLDHVIAKSKGGINNYRNIVATCYDANSMKNDKDVNDFARERYKEGIISLAEFKALEEKIIKLQNGEIKPNLELIKNEISS